MRGGTAFTYNAFWIQNPRVKAWYRRCEQQLQAAEMLATAASLRGQVRLSRRSRSTTPGCKCCLNMDRNTLWGAAGGMVFEHERVGTRATVSSRSTASAQTHSEERPTR